MSPDRACCCSEIFGELAELMCDPDDKPPCDVCGGLLDEDGVKDWNGEGLVWGCGILLELLGEGI